jgi:A/G-specific adenine glycosylase
MPLDAPRQTQQVIRQLVPSLLRWFSRNARDLPWRRTRDPYAIWVSEIMLQQTQVKTVVPYWERWMRELPTIQSAAKASPAKLHKLWEGLGYYTRVRNLQKAAQQIVAQHGGKFPKNFDDLLALPGVGRYTAGAIASIAFNQPRPILDGNVMRVLTRLFGVTGDPRERKTNDRLWQLAEGLVVHASCRTRPVAACSRLNQSLMELGALVCTPRAPRCDLCPARQLCVARRRDLQARLPRLGRRARPCRRRFVAFVVERNGKYLVRQRPAGVVNAHLWEFPNVEVGARLSEPQHVHVAARALKLKPTSVKSLCSIKHSITRYRNTLEAWRADFGGPGSTRPKLFGCWLTLAQLHRLAFTGAHKKILARLGPPSISPVRSCDTP